MPNWTYLKRNWVISRIVNPLLMRAGVVTTLRVRGRKSGRWRSVPVNVLDLEGERYRVAPRGETDWVWNLRAAGSGELRHRGRTERLKAIEVLVEEKPRVIQAYRDKWEGQVKSQFEALPEPADHPVFRIAPTRTREPWLAGLHGILGLRSPRAACFMTWIRRIRDDVSQIRATGCRYHQ